MITADRVIPPLLEACPSFLDCWETEVEHNPIHVDESGNRRHYVDAGRFGRHLILIFRLKSFDEVQASLDVVERLHTEGDSYVRNLATMGYLESLQNNLGWATDLEPSSFERFLGSETKRWWVGLNRFWAGEAPTVLPFEE